MNWSTVLIEFLGGLGIFLFSIRYLGDGLQRAYGRQLQGSIRKFTVNPILGVIAGMTVTVLIQSSSATTVLIVGLVNAGYLTLRQAVPVIMGANIGTTITAFFIGIDLIQLGLPILAAGAFLIYFFVNQKIQYLGKVLFGAGGIFFGLTLIGNALGPVMQDAAFQQLAAQMDHNPLSGVAIGTFMTVVVQSSSATVGILQELYEYGGLTLSAALPVLLGDNLGTTVTAVIAAIGASVQAKRAALSHVLFNFIGVLFFLLLLPVYHLVIDSIQEFFQLNEKLTIASAHGLYNITNTIIQLPFLAGIVWLIHKLIPGREEPHNPDHHHLDPIFLQQSPAIALQQAQAEVSVMGFLSVQGLEEAGLYANNHQRQYADLAMQLEKEINRKDRLITDYLSKLSASVLTEEESEKHTALMDAVRDIERIGDHFENIVEFIDFQVSSNISLTKDAQSELNTMFDLTISTVKQAVEALDKQNREAALAVLHKEDNIDKMERAFRKSHLIRMNEGRCTGSAGIVFVDIISNLERIGDHAVNIAELVLHN